MNSAATLAVGLGANVGSPSAIALRFEDARAKVADWLATPVHISSLYRTAPVGSVIDQPDFVNAALVACPARPPDPRALLELLLAVERDHGRRRDRPGGPRTLDLDLLWVGDHCATDAALTLPHPRLHQRAFVLIPLAELVGADCLLPGTAVTIAARLADPLVAAQSVERL